MIPRSPRRSSGWVAFTVIYLVSVAFAITFNVPEGDAVTKLSSAEEFEAVFKNGKAPTAIVIAIHTSTPECEAKLESVAFRGAHRYAMPEHLTLYTIPANGFTRRTCECACVAAYKKHASIDTFELTIDMENQPLTNWIRNLVKHSLTFNTGFPMEITIGWYDEGKHFVPQGNIGPGYSMLLSSHLSHVFVAKDAVTEELLDWMVINGDLEYTFTDAHRRQQCMSINNDTTCADPTLAFTLFAHQVFYQRRLGVNRVQPSLVPRLTSNGFERHRIPERSFEMLTAFYERHRSTMTIEEDVGPCMNQYEAPSFMAHLGPYERNVLSKELQPILERWAKQPLLMTSIYGIRKYTHGAVLRMHVDTVATRALSGILNIAQNTTEPWVLEIYDHDGHLNELVLEPGDILLYESAKLLHGRPKPLNGEFYSNAFIHFKPVSGWDMDWM